MKQQAFHPGSEEEQEDTVRLRLDIAYDGTRFHGWARQAAAPGEEAAVRTVQGELEDALSLILRHPVELTVAGRTDTGVHATGQVTHADVSKHALDQRSIDGEPEKLTRRLARLLEPDLRVTAVTEAPRDFDARFSALTRTYRYRVTTNTAGPNPLRRTDTAAWTKKIDLHAVQETATALVGLNDYAAFCKPRPHATTIRDVHSFTWRNISTAEEPELYEATITADAFCWHMVRALVATCLDAGSGAREVSWAKTLLAAHERDPLVKLAPANGLTLIRVDYPDAAQLGERVLVTRDRRKAKDVE